MKEIYEKLGLFYLGRLVRAKESVEKESADTTSSIIETGIAVLGALFEKTSPTKPIVSITYC